MDKLQKAEQLLEEKVKECSFEDGFYTLVYDLISDCTDDVESEIDGLRDVNNYNEGTMWYDDVHEKMLQILCDRIREWLG